MKSMPDNLYKFTKWMGLAFCPAASTFAGVVGLSTGWEYTDIAVTVIGAFGIFLASIIGASSHAYHKENEGE